MNRPVLAALSILSLTASAVPALAQPARQCFFARQVNRWADAGPNAIDVRLNSRDVYRLSLFAPCPELKSTLSIALDPAGGSSSVCEGDPNVNLVVRSSSRVGTVRCPIDTVRKLSPEEAASYGRRR